MDWISNYQLFLFDFDGLLVNTEELHFKAYQELCNCYGLSLNWDLHTYCKFAMFSHTGVKNAILDAFPRLQEFSWDSLYQEKKRIYLDIVQKDGAALMPGVKKLLEALEERRVKRCVVTHSPLEQIEVIRGCHPILNSISHWITREDYNKPKPDPECYQKAISLHAGSKDNAIGFEDSPRGLQSLLGTQAKGILISPFFSKRDIDTSKSFMHYRGLEELLEKSTIG